MSASLVGSEMCIRDRYSLAPSPRHPRLVFNHRLVTLGWYSLACGLVFKPVHTSSGAPVRILGVRD
eukprot:7535149-Alexandrium_andersonii.AAC.1